MTYTILFTQHLELLNRLETQPFSYQLHRFWCSGGLDFFIAGKARGNDKVKISDPRQWFRGDC